MGGGGKGAREPHEPPQDPPMHAYAPSASRLGIDNFYSMMTMNHKNQIISLLLLHGLTFCIILFFYDKVIDLCLEKVSIMPGRRS